MPDTAAISLTEIVAALNGLPEDERAAAVTLLQNDGGPVVRAFRSKVFAAGKKEGEKATGPAAEKLAESEAKVEELTAKVAELEAKAPEAKAIEERLTKAFERKLEAAEKRAKAAEDTLATERGAGFRSLFGKALRDLNVDPDYADEVLAGRYADRHVVNADGSRAVKKPGEDSTYDAADVAEGVKLLAADVAKGVPPKFLLSNADTSGGGITNGGGGAAKGGSQWDQIRKDVQTKAETRNRPTTTAAERMGLAPIAGGKP